MGRNTFPNLGTGTESPKIHSKNCPFYGQEVSRNHSCRRRKSSKFLSVRKRNRHDVRDGQPCMHQDATKSISLTESNTNLIEKDASSNHHFETGQNNRPFLKIHQSVNWLRRLCHFDRLRLNAS
ncbi:hypothetical protein K493DRAFT_318481 [Basidiobolus meristosporus CBS 931.73]|uniref:Uncharacterized protein n=1 Tax=Basidiobolus meristosporus CBS 931.73 TaxID=1314790 RepID=A0A1Y1XVH9_9FUNG|nr:hypothetical protein K493DRAFT_318481 [Basidiobolus meristosporus CBS 931.73]|eukprot:ORX89758.1 hypothetical protein K493DRAFT_318481 [Basidiobolus meristosporus CBS 931.73]